MNENTCRSADLFMLLFLVFVGTAILFLRNTDPVINPSMYTEDGVWTGFLYNVGALETYRIARPDYFVIGNIALLHLATILNSLVLGDNIDRLPEVVAVISYAFYSSVTAFVFYALRPYLALPWRLVAWIFVLLLPMGEYMNEILGRLSNIGYALYVVATLALMLRITRPPQRFSITVLGLDMLSLFCAYTNPLCAILLWGAVVICVAQGEHRRSLNTYLLLTFAALSLIAFKLALTPVSLGVGKEYSISGFIASGLGRPLLYPFLFPSYTYLTDLRVLCLCAALGAYLAAAWWVARDRMAYTFLIGALVLVTAATAFGRIELHTYLIGYFSSFPDRYFYAQNALVLLAFIWATNELVGHYPKLRTLPYALMGVLAAVWVTNAKLLFDPFVPTKVIRLGLSFPEQIAVARGLEGHPGTIRVNIYPEGWYVDYPALFQDQQNRQAVR